MVKRKSRKKNYNPFKMWGSWVGAGLILLPSIFSYKIFLYYAMYVRLVVSSISDKFYANYFIGTEYSLGLIIISFIGFLIGWGIHSLFRRFN